MESTSPASDYTVTYISIANFGDVTGEATLMDSTLSTFHQPIVDLVGGGGGEGDRDIFLKIGFYLKNNNISEKYSRPLNYLEVKVQILCTSKIYCKRGY